LNRISVRFDLAPLTKEQTAFHSDLQQEGEDLTGVLFTSPFEASYAVTVPAAVLDVDDTDKRVAGIDQVQSQLPKTG
jgi:hypothetical protein